MSVWSFEDASPMQMGPWEYDGLLKLAGPWPVDWLFKPREGAPKRVLNLFCGCGGWCTGIRRALGLDVDMVCVDSNKDAVATSNAAGCRAILADITTLDPSHPALLWVIGLILSPPCTDWTFAGKRLGHQPENIRILCNAFDDAREAAGNVPFTGMPGEEMTFCRPSGLTWDEVREGLEGMTAPTAGLMLEVAIWSLGLQLAGAALEFVAVEQSARLPREIQMEIWCDFELAGWKTAEWKVLDAADYGSPSHRERTFFMARYSDVLELSVHPEEPIRTGASLAIVCPPGMEVVTRGARKTSGGNKFYLYPDKQIPGITSKIRSWDVMYHGGRFTLEEIALLVSLPEDYPGVGSRSSVAQQRADIVAPVVSAPVIGTLLGVPWQEGLMRYLGELYPMVHGHLKEGTPGYFEQIREASGELVALTA